MKVTVSVAPALADGAETAQFMQALPKFIGDDMDGFLEKPVRMLA